MLIYGNYDRKGVFILSNNEIKGKLQEILEECSLAIMGQRDRKKAIANIANITTEIKEEM